MTKATIFDILIVYSDRLANSAGSLSEDVLAPFAEGKSYESYNVVYGYFLKVCQKNNLKAAFTTSADITGAGECGSYWLFEKNQWIKIRETCYSKVIFDKFSPINKRIRANRGLLFSSKEVKPFNNPYIFELFFDKQKAYKKLSTYSIPTVAVKDSTVKNINLACKSLKKIISKHAHPNDFSEEIIMKDRFGAGGRHVFKFKGSETGKIRETMKKNTQISYIIQPFTKFDKGFFFQNSFVSTDIRLIYMGGKIIQTYIRMAKQDDFRCNEHQGGTLKYLPKKEIPQNVITYSNKIAKVLNNNSSLFTLDFLIGNSGNIYLLEGNTSPGLDWNLSLKENEIEAQKLIRLIVKELVKRVGSCPPIDKLTPALSVLQTEINDKSDSGRKGRFNFLYFFPNLLNKPKIREGLENTS